MSGSMHAALNHHAEWLEADGLGGFASGTVGGRRTRRYHALLLTARQPPTERFVLVNGFEAWVETPTGPLPISSQYYVPGVVHPDGEQRLVAFDAEPWPTWRWKLENGVELALELFVPRGMSAVVLTWRVIAQPAGVTVPLRVRPLLSGRDYHALHRENMAIRHDHGQTLHPQFISWRMYPDVPAVVSGTSGTYRSDPEWYRQFLYAAEFERGLDHVEDLISPGVLEWELAPERSAVWILAAESAAAQLLAGSQPVSAIAERLRDAEAERRRAFPSTTHRAADTYLVRRGAGKTLVAGYPWFTDWGRDTFIALRGLCIATGQYAAARDILLAWADTVSEGMLPNRFPDHGGTPEYNAVDASLWFIIAAHDLYQACQAANQPLTYEQRAKLQGAAQSILVGYSRGTRYGIRCDTDGLLAAGVPGVQLTWMDAKVGDWVVTPRIGKPVEVQALWLNALAIGAVWDRQWQAVFDQGVASFRERFWNARDNCLFDLVDVNHEPGRVDDSIRANQIFAVGGLPRGLLTDEQARQVVAMVESLLVTPMGLRTLAPESGEYAGHYQGSVYERDGAYHQGTVWPWLLGPFVEAVLRVRPGSARDRHKLVAHYFAGLTDHLRTIGLGHLPEIADGDPPHTPRGCPWQAWSLGEYLRVNGPTGTNVG